MGHLREEKENSFLTGMFVRADIIIENTTAKAIPSEAVVEQEGRFYILRMLENNTIGYSFEQLEVQIGNITDGFTEIKNAAQFSPSDQFLTKGAFDVIGD